MSIWCTVCTSTFYFWIFEIKIIVVLEWLFKWPDLCYSCYQMRERLMELHPDNRRYLEWVETSTLIVVLDDATPTTYRDVKTKCIPLKVKDIVKSKGYCNRLSYVTDLACMTRFNLANIIWCSYFYPAQLRQNECLFNGSVCMVIPLWASLLSAHPR